jgi:hypothetical protein
VNNNKALILYCVPLKKIIGKADNKFNKLDKFKLVIFDVVPFIIFDVIVPEFDIDDDVIAFVCKFALLNILPLVVSDPEHTRLLCVPFRLL